LIKFQDRDLPVGNQELGHSFADTKDMQAKILSHVLSPNPASIVPKHQRNIIPKSHLKKSKIWKPGEPAHHFKDDTLSLEKLSQKDEMKAELVKLRFFGGLTIQDTARTLRISPATAKRYWAFARAWLLQEIG